MFNDCRRGRLTFAFDGVAITPDGEVTDTTDTVIDDLLAAGNVTGSLFYDNYPGGSGLARAAVYGRVFPDTAAEAASEAPTQ